MTARGRPDEHSLVSTRLLIDLVENTLDPGYAAAARRRASQPPQAGPRRRRYLGTLTTALGCLLIGFVLVVAYVYTHRGAPEAAKVHDSLVSRVRDAEHSGDGLADRLNTLEQQLAAAQAQSLPESGSLGRQLAGEQLAAGEVAVAGPGLTVTLREPPASTASPAPGRGGSTPIQATNILTDRDVRSVVNELWRDGAEAISVNDVRLTPTSAIRFAGQAVLVDFQPITSPYTIRAIGDPDGLSTTFAESSVASRYQTLAGVEHLGFAFTDSTRLTLPAGGPVTPRYASVPAARKRGHR